MGQVLYISRIPIHSTGEYGPLMYLGDCRVSMILEDDSVVAEMHYNHIKEYIDYTVIFNRKTIDELGLKFSIRIEGCEFINAALVVNYNKIKDGKQIISSACIDRFRIPRDIILLKETLTALNDYNLLDTMSIIKEITRKDFRFFKNITFADYDMISELKGFREMIKNTYLNDEELLAYELLLDE